MSDIEIYNHLCNRFYRLFGNTEKYSLLLKHYYDLCLKKENISIMEIDDIFKKQTDLWFAYGENAEQELRRVMK